MLFSSLNRPSNLDRGIKPSLKDRALAGPGSGPRIAVVGNCQRFGVAYAAKLLNVEAIVHRFHIRTKSGTDLKTLRQLVQECYRVYARHQPDQLADARVQGPLDNAEISSFLRDVAARGGVQSGWAPRRSNGRAS